MKIGKQEMKQRESIKNRKSVLNYIRDFNDRENESFELLERDLQWRLSVWLDGATGNECHIICLPNGELDVVFY